MLINFPFWLCFAKGIQNLKMFLTSRSELLCCESEEALIFILRRRINLILLGYPGIVIGDSSIQASTKI